MRSSPSSAILGAPRPPKRKFRVRRDAVGVSFGEPEALFELGPEIRLSFVLAQYDVSADGKRIYTMLPVEQSRSPRIIVVQNWLALLEEASD